MVGVRPIPRFPRKIPPGKFTLENSLPCKPPPCGKLSPRAKLNSQKESITNKIVKKSNFEIFSLYSKI